MKNKMSRFIAKNKRMLIFIPFYILYIITMELILGAGNNDIWDDGKSWANKEK